MSLLERLGRGHLSDSQFAKYWAEVKTEGAVHPHLATCEACRARYDRFEAWVAGVGAELRNEADEAFTPERQRSVFVLSHVEGRTSREVSALTGLNESTVRVHLFRAIRKLRTLLAADNGAAAGELKGKRRVTS